MVLRMFSMHQMKADDPLHLISCFNSVQRNPQWLDLTLFRRLSENGKLVVISSRWAAGYFRLKISGFSRVTNLMVRVSSSKADPNSNIGTPLTWNPCLFVCHKPFETASNSGNRYRIEWHGIDDLEKGNSVWLNDLLFSILTLRLKEK